MKRSGAQSAGEGTGGLIVLAAVGLALYAFWPDFGSERNVYTATCSAPAPSWGTCQKWAALHPPVTFIANKETQHVLRQTEGFPPSTLSSCVVRDGGNWRCTETSNGFFFDWSMVDGHYTSSLVLHNDPTNPQTLFQIPRWRWLYARFKDAPVAPGPL